MDVYFMRSQGLSCVRSFGAIVIPEGLTKMRIERGSCVTTRIKSIYAFNYLIARFWEWKIRITFKWMHWLHIVLLPAGLPRSGKLPVMFLLNEHFRPAMGDSLHRFTWNLARPRGTGSTQRHVGPLGRAKFHLNRCTGWVRGPKSWKFPLIGKEWPRRGEPLDRFLQMLGALMRPTTLHNCVKFDTYALDRKKMINTF